MKTSSSKLSLAALALVASAAFTMASAGRGGTRWRWRWRGGGANRASAGGAAGGNRAAGAQANNVNADKRTNEVRNTSVNNVNVNNNNVNVNKNVNVNVEGGGCCNNGWDNDYHPVATGRSRRRDRGRDLGRHRIDGEHRAAQLRAGELQRHGLPAVRHYLVPGAGAAIHRRQSAVLIHGKRIGRTTSIEVICNAATAKPERRSHLGTWPGGATEAD